MSIQDWLLAFLGCGLLIQLVRAILRTGEQTLVQRVIGATLTIISGVIVANLPRANKASPELLSGHIILSPLMLVVLIFLAILAVLCIIWAKKSSAVSAKLQLVSRQIALLVGCVVFGLPFLFLLITSFKEDQDMASPNGIIWIPRVVQTLPVLNPNTPYYEATYKGIRVRADLDRTNPDGTLSLRIAHPVFFGGYSFNAKPQEAKLIPRDMPLVTANIRGEKIEGVVFEEFADGRQDVEILKPESRKGERHIFEPKATEKVRPVSLRWKNYIEALEYLPPEAEYGWTYLRNTLWLVLMNVLGALISTSLVAYGFARLRFPGRETIFWIMVSTMMLPAAVTLLPQFLIFRSLGWIDSLKPLWVTSWFGSAFNIYLLRQFFQQIPYELEDAAKIDGCSFLKSLWAVMLPQVKPALVVIGFMTFMGAWNNFMGPLVYSSSIETLPISYAVQLFNGERTGDPGLLMAFVTMSLVPVIALFAFAQRFLIDSASLSGFGGR